ncbi:MAG: MerR family transcriptional regulator [Dermabacteraceae bacterium]
MRISELSAATDLPIGTIKYYLREGLLPAGHRSSRTTADYDATHMERLRLVRALIETGGLGLAAVRRVLTVIDAPDPQRLDVLATAQDALTAGEAPAQTGAADEDAEGNPENSPVGRAHAWVAARGWPTGPGDPVVERLERAWQACQAAGIDVDDAMMGDYADAMEQVAGVDVAAVPPGADDAVRRVVIGTIMMEPVLAALRLLAQREVSVRRHGRR